MWRFRWCQCRAGLVLIGIGILMVLVSSCGWWLMGLLGCVLCIIGTTMICRW